MARMSVDDRRSALVHAGLRVINRHGIAAATTRAITAEADMPLASFHYAFRSRDELMSEVISLVVENASLAAFASMEPGSDFRAAVRSGLQAYFDTVLGDPGNEQVMFELMNFALRTPELHDMPARQYAIYHDTTRSLLVAGADHCGVAFTMPVDDIARLVVTFTDGITLAWLADRDTDAATRMLDLAADAVTALTAPLTAQSEQPSRAEHTTTPTPRQEQHA